MSVKTVIGDKAYSSKENIDFTKEGHYELVARLNNMITQKNRTKSDEFEFNKDAEMYQCKAGHLAIHKYFDKRNGSGKNPRMIYFFDVEKCQSCPYKERCYKEGQKRRPIEKPLLVILTMSRRNFKKRNILKKKQKNDIKLKPKIVN